uniref:Aa_trans domain-containing protein n=1 Tax=Steinernema glaseri TaxID=37863 RepID=A0A1I7YR24_9BILA
MEHQLHMAPPPRVLLSFVLILGLLVIVRCGEQATVKGLVLKTGKRPGAKALDRFTAAFMLVICWVVATLNPSILSMIESFGGPVIAAILFLMPMYAIRRVPAMR